METTTTIFADLLSFPDGASEAGAVIRNYSDEPLVVEAGGASAPFFVVAADPPFGTPVPSGGSVRVTIRFAPEKPGTYARLLEIAGRAILCEGTRLPASKSRSYSVTAFKASTIPLP
jgi:hypothetical protein